MNKEKMIIEALLSHNGKADIDNVLKYLKVREPEVTRGDIEDVVERSSKVIKVGEMLYLND